MIRFDQTYLQDGQICGSVKLNGETIGEFRVSVPQWDWLRANGVDDLVVVLNEQEVREMEEEASLV